MTAGSIQQFVDKFVDRFTSSRNRDDVVFRDSRIVVGKGKFKLFQHADEKQSVPFDAVQLIFAYKRDLITTDLICFDLILKDGIVIEINEEMIGFDRFLDTLDRHFDKFDRQWADKVVYPAFAANRTCVFSAIAEANAAA